MNINKQTHIYNFKKKIDPNSFSIIQYEDKVVKSYYSNSYNLQPEKNTYTCSFVESKTLDFNKPMPSQYDQELKKINLLF